MEERKLKKVSNPQAKRERPINNNLQKKQPKKKIAVIAVILIALVMVITISIIIVNNSANFDYKLEEVSEYKYFKLYENRKIWSYR